MRAIVFGVLAALMFVATAAFAQPPLKFVTDADFAPYSMYVDGKPAGIDVDLLTEAARRAGLTLEIALAPWEEVLSTLRDGSVDGGMALFRSPEREKFALFMETTPIHFSDYVLFTKVGSRFDFNGYADLKSKTIGTVSGIALGKDFDAAAKAGTFATREYPELSRAIRGLLMGEIDAFAGNIDVAYYQLKDMGMTSSIVYLPRKIESQRPAYMVMSRASKYEEKELVIQQLERALDAMRKDGTYNSIARRYLFRF